MYIWSTLLRETLMAAIRNQLFFSSVCSTSEEFTVTCWAIVNLTVILALGLTQTVLHNVALKCLKLLLKSKQCLNKHHHIISSQAGNMTLIYDHQ